MILNIIMYIINNLMLIITLMFIVYSVVSWINIIKNRDFKYIKKCNSVIYEDLLIEKDSLQIRENIKYMDGREFEQLYEWIFKNSRQYKSVILTPAQFDEGKDLILTDNNNELTYVECKRYTEKATVTEDFMIGREICQKLVGSMVADNIKNGIIITTGSIHKNAWDYIDKLQNNTHITISILNLDDIMSMIYSIKTKQIII